MYTYRYVTNTWSDTDAEKKFWRLSHLLFSSTIMYACRCVKNTWLDTDTEKNYGDCHTSLVHLLCTHGDHHYPILNITLEILQLEHQEKKSAFFIIFNVTFHSLPPLFWKMMCFHSTVMTNWKNHWHEKPSNSPFRGVTCCFCSNATRLVFIPAYNLCIVISFECVAQGGEVGYIYSSTV